MKDSDLKKQLNNMLKKVEQEQKQAAKKVTNQRAVKIGILERVVARHSSMCWLADAACRGALQAKPAAGAGKKAEEEEEVDPTMYRQNRITAMEKREVSSAWVQLCDFELWC
jgi:hypothetical protein|eukprot:COSAG02_NODE_65_length_42645_cov_26.951934_38_plen_112_part_00